MFRKFSIQFLCILGIILSACSPDLPAPTFTPTATPEPTLTSTPLPTATITLTPTPSFPTGFPPEFQAQIGDADFELRDGHIWVTAVDGQAQDMFQLESDGDGWRYSDAKLISSAPDQNWWPESYVVTNEFIQRDVRGVFPEPENSITVKIPVADGSTITVSGPEIIIPDKNDPKVTHRMIYPISFSSTDGWSFIRDLNKFCHGNSGCGNGFNPNAQYLIRYQLYSVTNSQYPITDHLIKISLAQGFKDSIEKMWQGTVNLWPEKLIFQGGVIEEVKPLNLGD